MEQINLIIVIISICRHVGSMSKTCLDVYIQLSWSDFEPNGQSTKRCSPPVILLRWTGRQRPQSQLTPSACPVIRFVYLWLLLGQPACQSTHGKGSPFEYHFFWNALIGRVNSITALFSSFHRPHPLGPPCHFDGLRERTRFHSDRFLSWCVAMPIRDWLVVRPTTVPVGRPLRWKPVRYYPSG